MNNQLLQKAELLLDRLERITADSPWAHQASGIRSSLAKQIARGNPAMAEIEKLLEKGFQILAKAASEIPDRIDPENL